MSRQRRTAPGRAVVLATALMLSGCVDPIVNRPTGEVERWAGRAEAAGDEPGCGAVEFALFREGVRIGGTARPLEPAAEGLLAATRSWWVEGTVNPNGTVLFSLRRQGPLPAEGPRPASAWRGRSADGEIVAVEQPPSCGRQVRLVRQAGSEPAS